MNRYYIGFAQRGGTIGGIDIRRNGPIRGMDDLMKVQQDIRNHYGDHSLIVTAFSKFEEQDR